MLINLVVGVWLIVSPPRGGQSGSSGSGAQEVLDNAIVHPGATAALAFGVWS